MIATRVFETFSQFAAFVSEQAVLAVPIREAGIGAIARVLHRKTRDMFGNKALADLAPSTQAERLRLGFSANQPLLRDGSLLRDSVEMQVGPTFAAVGSPEDVMYYHEFGYFNKRSGTMVPPRPVFKLALEESAVPIIDILEAMTGAQLGFGYERIAQAETLSYQADITL